MNILQLYSDINVWLAVIILRFLTLRVSGGAAVKRLWITLWLCSGDTPDAFLAKVCSPHQGAQQNYSPRKSKNSWIYWFFILHPFGAEHVESPLCLSLSPRTEWSHQPEETSCFTDGISGVMACFLLLFGLAESSSFCSGKYSYKRRKEVRNVCQCSC